MAKKETWRVKTFEGYSNDQLEDCINEYLEKLPDGESIANVSYCPTKDCYQALVVFKREKV